MTQAVTDNPAVAGPAVAAPPEDWRGALAAWIRDRRPRRVVYWLAILWTLNLFDLAFTITAAQTGMFAEANPLVEGFVHSAQLWNIFAYKMIFLLLASWFFARSRRHWLCEAGLIFTTAVYLAVSVLWILHTPLIGSALDTGLAG